MKAETTLQKAARFETEAHDLQRRSRAAASLPASIVLRFRALWKEETARGAEDIASAPIHAQHHTLRYGSLPRHINNSTIRSTNRLSVSLHLSARTQAILLVPKLLTILR